MSRVPTNAVSLSHAVELAATPGILPGSPSWLRDEPNTISDIGSKIKSVVRRPLSRSRQLKKGIPVDLDSPLSFEEDLTMNFAVKHFEGFVYAEYVNNNLFFPQSDAGATGFTVPPLSAASAGKLQWKNSGAGAKSLIFSAGYTIAANNGLKVLTGDPVTTDVLIPVAGNSTETAPAKSFVVIAGIRAITGDLKIDVGTPTAGKATITAGQNGVASANQVDFTTLGLTVGQLVHVGGLTAGQQFSAGVGFGRVVSMTAGPTSTLVLDKISTGLVTDPGTGDTVDILFSRFLRNVASDQAVDDSRYLERTLTFELATPNLGGVGVDGYQYPNGNYYDVLEINAPETDKITCKASFVGFDTPVPTGTRKTNAANAIAPIGTTAYNTSSSYVHLRTDGVSAANTLFKSWRLSIKNNASPEKVHAVFGAAAMDIGQFEVSLDAEMIFADAGVLTAIRNNTTLTFDFLLKNGDGGIAVDFPALTFGDGGLNLPLDKSVRISVKFNPFADDTIDTSIGISLFPVLPA